MEQKQLNKFIRQVENFSKTQQIEIREIEKPEEKVDYLDENESDYFDDVSLPESLDDTGEVRDPQSILITGG